MVTELTASCLTIVTFPDAIKSGLKDDDWHSRTGCYWVTFPDAIKSGLKAVRMPSPSGVSSSNIP